MRVAAQQSLCLMLLAGCFPQSRCSTASSLHCRLHLSFLACSFVNTSWPTGCIAFLLHREAKLAQMNDVRGQHQSS